MADTKFNPQLWTAYMILRKQVHVKELRIKELRTSINKIEKQIEEIRPKCDDVFEQLPPVELWKESLLEESHWWHISRAITDDFWTTASHPSYIDREDYEYESKNGFDYMRPKVVGDYVREHKDLIDKVITEIRNV